ncbi:MAG: hypothetical protein JWL69_1337 [Phycisphaerales bacterium]|nr:hypothetical protein [Phycisphaerales bacterium]MDB5354183.1 hypothetical protein [Phycisphaerales bacterium]
MPLLETITAAALSPLKWLAMRKVDELATTIAVRQAVVREMVRLHFQRYVRDGDYGEKLDPDRAAGLAEKVIREVQNCYDWSTHDPEDPEIRSEIARAVTMAAIPLSVWVALQQLRKNEPFDSGHSLTLVYRDATGAVHHSGGPVAGLQRHFLFIKPFIFVTPATASVGDGVLARLEPEVGAMVETRLRGESIDLLKFVLSSGPSQLLQSLNQRNETGEMKRGRS